MSWDQRSRMGPRLLPSNVNITDVGTMLDVIQQPRWSRTIVSPSRRQHTSPPRLTERCIPPLIIAALYEGACLAARPCCTSHRCPSSRRLDVAGSPGHGVGCRLGEILRGCGDGLDSAVGGCQRWRDGLCIAAVVDGDPDVVWVPCLSMLEDCGACEREPQGQCRHGEEAALEVSHSLGISDPDEESKALMFWIENYDRDERQSGVM